MTERQHGKASAAPWPPDAAMAADIVAGTQSFAAVLQDLNTAFQAFNLARAPHTAGQLAHALFALAENASSLAVLLATARITDSGRAPLLREPGTARHTLNGAHHVPPRTHR